MDMPKIKGRRTLFAIIGVPVFLAVAYMATSAYYKNHFYHGTVINCVNASGKTEEEVNRELADSQENYALELQELNGAKEKILAKEIGLKYTSHDEVTTLKNNQNPFKWISGFLHKNEYFLKSSTKYDENLLKKRVDALSCLKDKNVVQPKDAALKYNGKTYEIEKEVDGNKVDKERLHDQIVTAVSEGKTSLNLEDDKCYYKPKHAAGDKDVVEAKDTLNKYLSSVITYDLDGRTEVVDSSKINEWLGVDSDFKVKVDEDKVRSYVGKLANGFDVIGKSVDFKTSDGNTIKVNDPNYRKVISRSKETEALISALKEGKETTRKPEMSITETPKIGNTYVEVNLAKQHVSFYKNGALVCDGDVVTGNVSTGNATPDGVYKLAYKQKDATLKGQDYSSPVGFWMPFNGGIGIHDATWRTEFGKEIYLTKGSHGCVNAPYSLAESIFNNIDSGTAVICHN